MARLPLVLTPNPMLKMKSALVETVDKDLQKFMDDLLETMYHEEGAGIAAVQVGVLKRIFILDIERKEGDGIKNPQFFINPEITYYSKEKCDVNEGCLSFPGARAVISRSSEVTVKYLDYDGKSQEMTVSGYMARGVLHENDHLNGITMPDHLSAMKRDVFARHVKKYLRNHTKN